MMFSGKKLSWILSGDNYQTTVNDRVVLYMEEDDSSIVTAVVDKTKKLVFDSDGDTNSHIQFITDLVDMLCEDN